MKLIGLLFLMCFVGVQASDSSEKQMAEPSLPKLLTSQEMQAIRDEHVKLLRNQQEQLFKHIKTPPDGRESTFEEISTDSGSDEEKDEAAYRQEIRQHITQNWITKKSSEPDAK
jgi:hypothetical protein